MFSNFYTDMLAALQNVVMKSQHIIVIIEPIIESNPLKR